MSRYEGVSRIAKVIRGVGWLVIFGGAAVMLSDKNLGPDSVELGIGIIAVLSVPCFALAWIVDGFAK